MIETAQAFGVDIGGSGIKAAPVNLEKGEFGLGYVQEFSRLVLGRAFAQRPVLNGKPPQLLCVFFAEQVKGLVF